MELIVLLFWVFGVILAIGLPVGLTCFIIWFLTKGVNKNELDKEVRKSARYLGKLSAEFSKGKRKSK